jgi:hypothetical protein
VTTADVFMRFVTNSRSRKREIQWLRWYKKLPAKSLLALCGPLSRRPP